MESSQNNENEPQQDRQKLSNPIRTFLGISNRGIIYQLFIYLAFVPVIVCNLLPENIYFTVITYVLSTLCFVMAAIYYIKERKYFIKDYQNVKIGKIPLLPTYSYDFPMKDSIIMLVLILIGIVLIGFLANLFVK